MKVKEAVLTLTAPASSLVIATVTSSLGSVSRLTSKVPPPPSRRESLAVSSTRLPEGISSSLTATGLVTSSSMLSALKVTSALSLRLSSS